ncbi:unannotated protein [freshwater metagenome]|uniref:Unannotated protein n=1 Tax=freshwater metagenome TaxID=449393 RepID=A0A6J6N1F8_9ZZZZ|nr:glycosyltransferase [Actinomycetota bacterium]MSZ06026.1 glycosyltransferase [Actinomycetota bacterium]
MAAQAALDAYRVTAIIVTHDGELWLPATVAALTSQSRPIDHLMAVDTASTDASMRLLKSARIPIIQAERDCGFGEAVTLAVDSMKHHTDEKSEWIWLIHDDCAPASTALEYLLEAIHDRPQVAMVGPKLLGWHDRTHLLEAGISIAGNGARWTGLEPLEYDQGQHDGIHEVLAVSTAGALIRRDIFEEIGGFDINLSLFRDDVDFGWRARVAGHSVLVTTKAIAFHAQASATERRVVDVAGAFLHRPLLLDRRNAAYVLLANSSWWMIPWLAIQLLGSALARSIGYLVAKLPGYASDELLAVASLIIRPSLIFKARRARKAKRFVSARIISAFIPPRWSQLRLGTSRLVEKVRVFLLPSSDEAAKSSVDSNEDEDLLVPTKTHHWFGVFRKPEVLGFVVLAVFTLLASRNRLGSLIGGALPASPSGARDLWRAYFESWHQVGMGSSNASPPWIALLAIGATIFLGKAGLLVTTLFLCAPLLMMWSIFSLFKRFTTNNWISIPASFLYAISPVAVAAINSGRLGTVAVLIIAPQIPLLLWQWKLIEVYKWRRIFGGSILFAVLYSFTLVTFIIAVSAAASAVLIDYLNFRTTANKSLFLDRLYKRLTLVFLPLLLTAPYSFEAFIYPSRLLTEPGISTAGGNTSLALLANPGGEGAMPWWIISPVLLILIVSLFSSSSARIIAYYGVAFLSAAVFFSSFTISSHGNSASSSVWVGSFLVGATICAATTGVVILDRLRTVLISSNINFRHIFAALLLLSTAVYSILTLSWSISAGANSPVRSNSPTVMPAFLSAENETKILVLRAVGSEGSKSVQYYISRGADIELGEPDVAPRQIPALVDAAQSLLDGTGITSSKVLAQYGIKYVFVKTPFDQNVIQTIDGLGGFARASATSAGVVWKVSGVIGRLVFTAPDGSQQILDAGDVGARTTVPSQGTVTVTEAYDRSWQILQNGYRLIRSENELGLPVFSATEAGEISLIHDGTIRRAWLSFAVIIWVVVIILALPAGRRKREISEKELA